AGAGAAVAPGLVLGARVRRAWCAVKPKPKVTKDRGDGRWYVERPAFGFAREPDRSGSFATMRGAVDSVLNPTQVAAGSASLDAANEPCSSKHSKLGSQMWPAVYR